MNYPKEAYFCYPSQFDNLGAYPQMQAVNNTLGTFPLYQNQFVSQGSPQFLPPNIPLGFSHPQLQSVPLGLPHPQLQPIPQNFSKQVPCNILQQQQIIPSNLSPQDTRSRKPTRKGPKGINCKVQGCNDQHRTHYCKSCRNHDSDHFSQDCQKTKQDQHKQVGCRVRGCKEDHSSHYCKNCDNKNSDHFAKECQEGQAKPHLRGRVEQPRRQFSPPRNYQKQMDSHY